MQYLLPDKVYQVLKWVGLIAMPALAVFIGVLGNVWGWAYTDAIVATLNAIGVLIGALVGASQISATGDLTNGEVEAVDDLAEVVQK